MTTCFKAIVVVSFVWGLPSSAFGQASFQGLGDLPGGSFVSVARNVSADGSVVVGWSSSDSGGEAFRWTASGGMQGLGDLPGGDFRSAAYGVSANGAVVVGSGHSGRQFTGSSEPVYWTAATGMQPLTDPLHPSGGIAFGVSADGTVIVGTGVGGRWINDGTGWMHSAMTGCTDARGISANGLVVVGTGPCRWVVGLGSELLGGDGGMAYRASRDGSVIVGWTRYQSVEFAFRWVESRPPLERMERLADPTGTWTNSEALDVTADGSIIVGSGRHTNEPPFVWDVTNGMRNLPEVLEHDYCLDLTGWTLARQRGL